MGAGDLTKRSASVGSDDSIEVGVIPSIQHLSAELHVAAILDVEVLEEAKIPLIHPRTPDEPPAGVAEMSRRWSRKGILVEPSRNRLGPA